MGRLGLRRAGGVLGLPLGQQAEKSLTVLMVKLPMVVPIQCEQRGVNGQHGGVERLGRQFFCKKKKKLRDFRNI